MPCQGYILPKYSMCESNKPRCNSLQGMAPVPSWPLGGAQLLMKPKSLLSNLLLILFSLSLCLAFIEFLLRAYEFRVQVEYGLQPHLKRWARFDPLLGWRNSPGVWEVDCERRPMTILEDGARKTSGQNPAASKRILLAGGSWIQGYGVRDDQTLASYLQQRFSTVNFVNLATAGYGSYQSYLLVKDYLGHAPPAETLGVILGVANHSLIRDVADYRWIKSLITYAGVHFVPPYILPEAGGSWREYPPEIHNLWGLADKIDLVLFAQGLQLFAKTKDRGKLGMDATKHVLGVFDGYLKAQQARLVVLNLYSEENLHRELEEFCKANRIPYIDGNAHSRPDDPAWYLHGDDCWGHPNEKMHALWAERVAEALTAFGVR